MSGKVKRGALLALGGVAALGVVFGGCATPATSAKGAPAWSSGSASRVALHSGLEAERWFPLVDGHLYQYRTTSEDRPAGILVARVGRTSNGVGELRTPSGTRRFQYGPSGLSLLRDGAWVQVFRLPMDATPWRGEHGGAARWEAQDLHIDAPSGSYDGCARMVEQRGGDRPARFATTFCPDVGVVILEATSGEAMERADLAYVGPPFDMGPDGTTRMP